MPVGNSVHFQEATEQLAGELRMPSRPRYRADIRDLTHLVSPEQRQELLSRAGRMPDRVDHAITHTTRHRTPPRPDAAPARRSRTSPAAAGVQDSTDRS